MEEDGHKQLQSYMKELLKLYKTCPALYENDFNSDGFEWINCMEWEKNLLIFLRKTKKREDTLLIVCNFSNVEYDDFMIGVPYQGKYKEISRKPLIFHERSAILTYSYIEIRQKSERKFTLLCW